MMNEIVIAIQGVSALALFKIAVDLGKLLQMVQSHEKRLDKLEDRDT